MRKFVIFMLLSAGAFSDNQYPNCEVVLEYTQAQAFIAILAMGKDFCGEIIKGDLESQIATVKVYVDPKYCAKIFLNSFDIAKRMSEMAKLKSLGIYSISAQAQY